MSNLILKREVCPKTVCMYRIQSTEGANIERSLTFSNYSGPVTVTPNLCCYTYCTYLHTYVCVTMVIVLILKLFWINYLNSLNWFANTIRTKLSPLSVVRWNNWEVLHEPPSLIYSLARPQCLCLKDRFRFFVQKFETLSGVWRVAQPLCRVTFQQPSWG